MTGLQIELQNLLLHWPF